MTALLQRLTHATSKVNPDKLQCIVFGKVLNPYTFLINSNVVRPEERVKLLGVHIDKKKHLILVNMLVTYARKLANKLRFCVD